MADDVDGYSLTKVQRAILAELLIGGDSTAVAMTPHISPDRTYITQMLRDLEEQGLVTNKGGGNYQLTIDGVAVTRALIRNARDQGADVDPRGWFDVVFDRKDR